MRVARRVMTAVIATVLSMAASGLAVRIYMGRETEDRLAPREAVSIAELRAPLPKPSFLACPPGYCAVAGAIASPLFDQSGTRLYGYWKEVISGEPRIISVAADPQTRRYVYIQHSPTFRFPDVITVEIVELASDRSSIAIYSRSRYGRYDFSKNRKRVEKWLGLLEKLARPSPQLRALAP